MEAIAVSTRRAGRRLSPGLIAAICFAIVTGSAALAINPRDVYGIKGDESTYVLMALSLARDGDLRYDKRDLERFWQVYGHGPEGVFLKRGGPLRPRLTGSWPFIRFEHPPDRAADRLYFAKALLYAVAAAPFAFIAGVQGLFLMNVLLLAAVLYAGYQFLAARNTPAVSLLFVTAFVGASATVIYAAWLTHEVLNFALIFLAYFFWLYKEVIPADPTGARGGLRSPRTDLLAAALIGLASYAKPPNLLMAGPIVLWYLWRRQFVHALVVSACFALFVAGGFGVTALITGDANYQGGDRKTFYGSFPFESRDATFDTRGMAMATNEVGNDESFEQAVFWPRLRANAEYFFVGRHFGFVPYYFPGVVAVALCLIDWRRRTVWQIAILMAVAATALVLLIKTPFSWSGGGGPPGNRYFLSIYPALFFVVPAVASVASGIAAWAGGALFIAHIVIQPFYASKFPWVTSQRGLLRLLPVELTMADDLPVRLNLERARITYSEPPLLIYLVDENAYQPEPVGIWIAGAARADILVRSDHETAQMRVRLESPISNDVALSAGGPTVHVRVEPGQVQQVLVPVEWINGRPGVGACLLSVRTSSGFVPQLRDATSGDKRFLGVLIDFAVAIPTAQGPRIE